MLVFEILRLASLLNDCLQTLESQPIMPRNLPESLIVSDFEQSRFRVGGIKRTTDNCFMQLLKLQVPM